MHDPRPPALFRIAITGVVLAAAAVAQAEKPKRGPWNSRSDAPKGWIVHETRHYQVQSQAGLEKAKRLGEHMEAMLACYVKLFPIDRSLKQFPIKLFANRGAFRAYGAPPSAAAYYSASDREMVCYDTGRWMDEEDEQGQQPMSLQELMQKTQMDLLGVAAHEGWHQYFHRYIGSWVEIPSWINEGMGDYFYCAKPRTSRGRRLPPELGRLNDERLPVARWAVERGQNVPLKDLITYSQRQYYARAGICYSQGWALCHFLLQSENKKYQRVIPKFIELVRSDTNMEEVTRKAFQDIDIAQLEKELNAWLLATKSPREQRLQDALEELRGDAAEPREPGRTVTETESAREQRGSGEPPAPARQGSGGEGG